MRKVIVLEHISIDGVIQSPGGPKEDTSGDFPYGGWTVPFANEVAGTAIRRQMNSEFDLLIGRKTYDNWVAYWPYHADIWPGVNTATKYIASNTVTSSEWQPTIFLNGDVATKVTQIKQQPGPDLNVWGSGNLLQTLIRNDLVDEYWLIIYPVTLGTGKRLFADGTMPAAFKVKETIVAPNGVIVVNYEREGALEAGGFE